MRYALLICLALVGCGDSTPEATAVVVEGENLAAYRDSTQEGFDKIASDIQSLRKENADLREEIDKLNVIFDERVTAAVKAKFKPKGEGQKHEPAQASVGRDYSAINELYVEHAKALLAHKPETWKSSGVLWAYRTPQLQAEWLEYLAAHKITAVEDAIEIARKRASWLKTEASEQAADWMEVLPMAAWLDFVRVDIEAFNASSFVPRIPMPNLGLNSGATFNSKVSGHSLEAIAQKHFREKIYNNGE